MDSFEQIYELYFKDVYRYILSLCQNSTQAEEITQETFYQAMKSMPSFRGDCKMTVWLCQIARHIFYADQKKTRRSMALSGKIKAERINPFENTLPSPEQMLCSEADAAKIHDCLHQMEEPYKEVFMLRVFAELPFQKISRIFGKTESWARVTYHRAKLKIIRKLEESNE